MLIENLFKKNIIVFWSTILFSFFFVVVQGKSIVFNFNYDQAIDKQIAFYQSSLFYEPYVQQDIKVSELEVDSLKRTYTVIIENLKKPTLLVCRAIGLANTWNTIYAVPGDILSVEIISLSGSDTPKYMLSFVGENAERYNISGMLNRFDRIKFKTNDSYFSCYKALEDYEVSFKKEIDATFFDDALKLFMLRMSKISLINAFNNYLKTVLSISDKEIMHYTRKVVLAFNVPEDIFLQTNQFVYPAKTTLQRLDLYYNPNRDFYVKCELITKHFKGKLKEFLLADAQYKYIKQNILSENEIIKINAWYLNFKQAYPNSPYLKYAHTGNVIVNKIKRDFPVNVMSIQLIDEKGMSVSFESLLKKYHDSPLLLDNWATWCGPCIEEFNLGYKVVEKLKAKGLKFLYISIDKDSDFDKFKEMSQKYGVQSYKILDKYLKTYQDYLELNYIPRYILIDKESKMVNYDMPRPSTDLEFRKQLVDALN